jgi:hypothetical protein
VVLLTALTTFCMSIAIQGMEGLVKFVNDYCLNFLLNKRIGDTDYVWSNPHFHIVFFIIHYTRAVRKVRGQVPIFLKKQRVFQIF